MKKSPRQIEREAASLLRHLRSHPYGRLMICEVRGGLWWTDSYVAARADQAVERLLADYNLKPEPMVCSVGRTIVRTDNAAPKLADLLDKAAVLMSEELDARIAALSSLIEPLIVVVLGGAIGVILVAMYLPIFRLGQVF